MEMGTSYEESGTSDGQVLRFMLWRNAKIYISCELIIKFTLPGTGS